jgi:hypothetical protein
VTCRCSRRGARLRARQEHDHSDGGSTASGLTIADAQRDLDRVASGIRADRSEFARESLRFSIVGMQSDAFADVTPALTVLFAGGGFVLLICCVNVAGSCWRAATIDDGRSHSGWRSAHRADALLVCSSRKRSRSASRRCRRRRGGMARVQDAPRDSSRAVGAP